jgi:hypothetical protein
MPPAQDSDDIKVTEESGSAEGSLGVPAPASHRPRRKRHFFLWTLFFLLILAFLWLATSSNPFAEGFQEFAGNKHDQAVVDTPFSVAAHSFRYYKFSLPGGSMNVAIVGDFTATEDSENGKKTKPRQMPEDEKGIEVYVLNEPAFAIWQTGYAAGSVFQSERVSQGKVQADLPTGAGIYYLVFSNKFCSKVGKKVDATVVLRYKSWIPDWLRKFHFDW